MVHDIVRQEFIKYLAQRKKQQLLHIATLLWGSNIKQSVHSIYPLPSRMCQITKSRVPLYHTHRQYS